MEAAAYMEHLDLSWTLAPLIREDVGPNIHPPLSPELSGTLGSEHRMSFKPFPAAPNRGAGAGSDLSQLMGVSF